MTQKKILLILTLTGLILFTGGAFFLLWLFYGLPPHVSFVMGFNAGFVAVLTCLIVLSMWKGMES